MRVLLVGAGTVGEAIAKVAADRPWLEQMIVTDYDADRARFVVDSTPARRALHRAPDRRLVGDQRGARRRAPTTLTWS